MQNLYRHSSDQAPYRVPTVTIGTSKVTSKVTSLMSIARHVQVDWVCLL